MSIKGSKHRKPFIATIFCSRVMPVKNSSGPPPPPNWCHPKSHFDPPDVSYFPAKFGKERIKANKVILN